MLRIIASNFLNIENDWAVVEKYPATVVYVELTFFPNS